MRRDYPHGLRARKVTDQSERALPRCDRLNREPGFNGQPSEKFDARSFKDATNERRGQSHVIKTSVRLTALPPNPASVPQRYGVQLDVDQVPPRSLPDFGGQAVTNVW